ncbi:shikimate dehydrogenase [Anaerofustis sp.]|uniref:shikimate dehydrogenase family protein n=1 Tax=Anaerofustis sp. TaxID=1872517 RepID=UPI0025BC6C73|nr:shikimate dehydrogenase [Anaerofustis sp.]
MKKFGLIGEKLPHSFSKILHGIAFDVLGLDFEYELYEVSKESAIHIKEFMNKYNLNGLNVTIPYKQVVMDNIDVISTEAKRIGAVNTILNADGVLYGYNTDYYGFKYTLENNNIDVKNKKVVVLGSGGASKAVLACLEDLKASKVYLVSRNKENKKVARDVELIDYEGLKSVKGELIVNTTPVGMYPNTDFSPVYEDILSNFNVSVDVIYNPLVTKFMKISKKLGKRTYSGLEMLIMQGLRSEEIWNDFKISKEDIGIIINKVKKEI